MDNNGDDDDDDDYVVDNGDKITMMIPPSSYKHFTINQQQIKHPLNETKNHLTKPEMNILLTFDDS